MGKNILYVLVALVGGILGGATFQAIRPCPIPTYTQCGVRALDDVVKAIRR